MHPNPSTRLAAAVSAVALAFAGVACTKGGDPVAGPTTASPSPSPSPSRLQAEPVRGDTDVQLFAISNEQAVWDRGQPEVDPAVVEAIANRVQNWLNAHLSDLQEGGPGRLDEVAAPGLLDGAPAEAGAAVTTSLTSPERLVDRAAYAMVVAHTDAPQWIRATAQVTGRDGATRTAHFVFEVAEDSMVLVAAGPGTGEG